MLLTTVAYVGYLALSQTQLSGSWRQFAIGSAMVLAGAALGKILGLFYWNLLLRRTALRLRSMVAAHPKTPTRTHSLQTEFSPLASANPGKFH